MPEKKTYWPPHIVIIDRLVDVCHGLHVMGRGRLKLEAKLMLAQADMTGTFQYTLDILSGLIVEIDIPANEIPATILRLQAAEQKLHEVRQSNVCLSKAIADLQRRS